MAKKPTSEDPAALALIDKGIPAYTMKLTQSLCRLRCQHASHVHAVDPQHRAHRLPPEELTRDQILWGLTCIQAHFPGAVAVPSLRDHDHDHDRGGHGVGHAPNAIIDILKVKLGEHHDITKFMWIATLGGTHYVGTPDSVSLNSGHRKAIFAHLGVSDKYEDQQVVRVTHVPTQRCKNSISSLFCLAFANAPRARHRSDRP